jgi:hypothetical protein
MFGSLADPSKDEGSHAGNNARVTPKDRYRNHELVKEASFVSISWVIAIKMISL